MFIILIVLIVILLALVLVYNMFIHLKNNIKNSKGLIDVYLQQRFDLIPNLVEVTSGYVKHEQESLERIALLRTSYNISKDFQTVENLTSEFNNMLGVVENNPDLKANETFLKLQKTLVKIESQLQAARRIYNLDVTKYNTKLGMVPFNYIAKLFKFTEEKLFSLEGQSELKINF